MSKEEFIIWVFLFVAIASLIRDVASLRHEIAKLTSSLRATELRNEAIGAGADELGNFVSCPKCGERRNQYGDSVIACQHCGDRTFSYVR